LPGVGSGWEGDRALDRSLRANSASGSDSSAIDGDLPLDDEVAGREAAQRFRQPDRAAVT
jgi:hypothetical protein